ncbi:multivesicular body subunit 12B-like isoform X1 [Littorina saxatilis]
MDSYPDLPITGICVISDPSKAPPNFTVIDKTFDKSEDADLWKDGLWGRRTMRYLCVERSVPDMSKDVLIDVAFINERDPIPPGFTVVENTHDTREKALKKKLLCGRWMLPNMTTDAITELIFLSRSCRKPPPGYTLVGETNNMNLCYKMGKIALPMATPTQPQAVSGIQGYVPQPYNMIPVGSALPYQPRATCAGANTSRRIERSNSNAAGAAQNGPLCGIPWQLNSRFQTVAELHNICREQFEMLGIPDIRYKTLMDIEREYEYDFRAERQAARVEPGLSLKKKQLKKR